MSPSRRHRPRFDGVTAYDYSSEETAWLQAVEKWKCAHAGRVPAIPTQVLHLARALGYRRVPPECSGPAAGSDRG